MPRPHRPNPFSGPRIRVNPNTNVRVPEAQRAWLSTHVRQETRSEMKTRKRAEAEARSPLHTIPNSRRDRIRVAA